MAPNRVARDLEKRLSTAYDAGFFDGYHQGIDDTHQIWVTILPKVKGVGPKLMKEIQKTITIEIQRRQEERKLQKNEVSQYVSGEHDGEHRHTE